MTDTALVPLNEAPFTWKTLTAIVSTEFVPKGLRGNAPAALAAILTGRELGLGPMAAMRGIDMIEGNPSLGGETLLRMIWEAGHRVSVTEFGPTGVTVKGERIVDGEVFATAETSFTEDDARRAKLMGKFNWQQYPADMMQWRAVTRLARFLFADVIAGARITYTPDELGSDEWVPLDHTEVEVIRHENDTTEFVPVVPDPEVVDVVASAWAELLSLVEGVDVNQLTVTGIAETAHRLDELSEACGLQARYSESVDAFTAATGDRPGNKAAHATVLGAFLAVLEGEVSDADHSV